MSCVGEPASTLRCTSIPFLVLYVGILPIIFCVAAFVLHKRVRWLTPVSKKLEEEDLVAVEGSPPTAVSFMPAVVAQYTGSLFTKYRGRFFWWEIVAVVRKLTLAIVLKSISRQSPFQSAAVFFILSASAFIQHIVRPWRLTEENILDSLGLAILIITYGFYTGSVFVGHSSSSNFILQLLSILVGIAFVLGTLTVWFYKTIKDKTPYQTTWEAAAAHRKSNPSQALNIGTPDSEVSSMDPSINLQ
jgi:hypothetical protein